MSLNSDTSATYTHETIVGLCNCHLFNLQIPQQDVHRSDRDYTMKNSLLEPGFDPSTLPRHSLLNRVFITLSWPLMVVSAQGNLAVARKITSVVTGTIIQILYIQKLRASTFKLFDINTSNSSGFELRTSKSRGECTTAVQQPRPCDDVQ